MAMLPALTPALPEGETLSVPGNNWQQRGTNKRNFFRIQANRADYMTGVLRDSNDMATRPDLN